MRIPSLHARSLIYLLPLVMVLLVLLALVMVDLFDTRLFRSLVATRVEESTGHEVQVAALDLKWGLPPRVVIENLRIANAEWGSTPNMLVIPAATVFLDPGALLAGPPYAHLELQDPDLVLETSANGEHNWSIDSEPESDSGEQAALPITLHSEGGQLEYHDHQNDGSYILPMELFTLQTGDEQTGATADRAIEGTLQAHYQELPVEVDASLVTAADGSMRGQAAIGVGVSQFDGRIEVDGSAMPLSVMANLHSGLVDADQLLSLLPTTAADSGAASLELAVLEDLNVELALEITELRLIGMIFQAVSGMVTVDNGVFAADLASELDSAAFAASVQLDINAPAPVLHAQLDLQESDAAPLLATLGLPVESGQVSGQITANLHPVDGALPLTPAAVLEHLAIPQATLRYEDDAARILLQAEITEAGGNPEISAEITGTSQATLTAFATAPPLRELTADSYPIQASITAPAAEANIQLDLLGAFDAQDFTLDFAAEGTALPAFPALGFEPPPVPEFSLEGKLQKANGGWSLSGAQLALGQSRMTGELTWQPAQQPPFLQADIDASVIDLASMETVDELLPEPELPGAPELAATDAGPGEQASLHKLLNAIEMDISLNVEQLLLSQNFSLTNVQMQLMLEDGQLRVEPLRFSTKGGSLAGNVTAEAGQEAANVDISLTFDDLRPDRFAPDSDLLAELPQPLGGNLQLSLAEYSLAQEPDPLALPMLERIVLERAAMNLRTPQGDTDLELELVKDRNQEADGQGLRLHAEGRLRNTPVEADLAGGSLLALRNTSTPYEWQLDLNAGDAELQLDGSLVTASSPPALEMRFSVQQTEQAELSELLTPWLPASLPELDVAGSLAWQDGDIAVENLEAQLGNSDVAGNFSYSMNAAGVPAINATLHSRKLDITELRSLQRSESDPAAVESSSGETSRPVLPQEELNLPFLERLNAEVQYTAADLYLDEAALGSLKLGFTAKQGHLVLDPLSMEIADGQMLMEGEMNARQGMLQGSIQGELHRLNLATLFRDTELVKDQFGRLGGQAKFWMSGDSPAALLGSLDGGLMLMLGGGRIDPVLVEGAGLDIGEALLAAAGIGEAIPVNCAFASAYARNGTLNMDRVVVDTDDSTFYLQGSVDLQQETLDLVLYNETKDLAVIASDSPVGLRGTFRNPSVVLLTEELVTDLLQGAALAALAAPAAALLGFIDADTEEDTPPACSGWVQNLQEAL